MPIRVYREAYQTTPPAHAERKGDVVRWKTRRGKWVEGVPLPSGKVRVTVAGVWYYSFTGPDGKPVRGRKGLRDHAATESLARREQLAADRQRAGLDPPAGQVHPEAAKPIRSHLADYLAHLRAKGRVDQYVREVERQVTAVLDGVRPRAAADLTPAAVETWVGTLRGREGEGIGPRTATGYAKAVASFLRWLRADRRIPANPLADWRPERDGTDVRRRRRRLTDPEFDRVLAQAARSAPVRRVRNARPHGEARAVLYLVAAYSGIRAEELSTLTPAHFYLTGPVPHLALTGLASKRGREDLVPFPPAVVPRIAAFLEGRPAGRPVWPGKWYERAAELVAADLAACDPPIPYRDARGRYADFHALRRTYIRKLRDAGVSVEDARKLARHSTVNLTLEVYRDEAELEELGAAAAKLAGPGGQPGPAHSADTLFSPCRSGSFPVTPTGRPSTKSRKGLAACFRKKTKQK